MFQFKVMSVDAWTESHIFHNSLKQLFSLLIQIRQPTSFLDTLPLFWLQPSLKPTIWLMISPFLSFWKSSLHNYMLQFKMLLISFGTYFSSVEYIVLFIYFAFSMKWIPNSWFGYRYGHWLRKITHHNQFCLNTWTT